MLEPILPLGDYCGGLNGFLNVVFYGGLLLLVFLANTIFNIIKFKKTKKFDFIPLILTLAFSLTYFALFDNEPIKFWTKKSLTGFVIVENSPRSGRLLLYENGTFAATAYLGDHSCTYQGDYSRNENRIVLCKEDLVMMTSSVFSSEYHIDLEKNLLVPIDGTFTPINIIN